MDIKNLKIKNMALYKKILIGLVIATVVIGAVYLSIAYKQPLDQPLALPTFTPDPDEELSSDDPDDAPSQDQAGESTPTLEPVCGGPPSLNILVSGVAANNYLYGLADAVRIARVDFQNQRVTVLALPRDLWVEIPGLEARGITAGKLNQAYFYGTEGMGYYSGAGYGSGLLAETLLSEFGFRADNYVAVNLYGFRKIIDTLGGIDVYLAQDVYRKEYDKPKLFLSAGYHHLDGKDAEMLARHRITIGDFGRIDNQTVIMKAVAAQLLSPSGIAAIPTLVEQLKTNVQTDLSPADLSQLVCLAGMLDYETDLVFATLPQDLLEEDMVFDPVRNLNTSALVADKDAIREILEDFQAGIWPPLD